jgi:hypothetical protein
MSDYTPGPWGWTYDGSSTYSVGRAEDPQGFRVACIYDRRDDRGMANARLIAAAPDLLEMLQRCAELLDDYSDIRDGDDGTPRPNRAMSLLQDVEAVIAKAEGR